MPQKTELDLEIVRALHQAGQLDQAKQGYLALLRKNPRNADILHSLGILCAQQEDFAEAAEHLENAVKYNPNDLSLQLHLANVLKMQGLFNQAAQLLQVAIAANPGYLPALNNLGTVYYAQGKLSEAIQAYSDVIAKEPNYIDAYYNLGLALNKNAQYAEAIATYKTLLEISPNHFAARFWLACVLMQQEKIPEALHEFLVIEQTNPYHFETQTNLATCYLKQGAINEAKAHYLKALELAPDDTQILFNLGVINMQQGNLDTAIQLYQRAVKTHPDYFAAHNNLAVAFLAKQHLPFALHHFQEALRLQPENKSIAYTVEMLSQNKRLLAAPSDYVKSLFDAYADHYENHLLQALDYKLPSLLHDAVFTVAKPEAASWDILDLGCGTGLCGLPFKPAAQSLTGIDLSEKMLAVAKEKNIYDSLVNDDLVSFLSDKMADYDLVLAGDVFVYIGDLEAIFSNVTTALRPGGLFTFNTEISDETDYKMNQSGRFAHQKKYLDHLADQNNLKIAYYKKVITRMQNNEPVYGHLYVLRKI